MPGILPRRYDKDQWWFRRAIDAFSAVAKPHQAAYGSSHRAAASCSTVEGGGAHIRL